MPLDHNGHELKVGDVVRRHKDWINGPEWVDRTFKVKAFRNKAFRKPFADTEIKIDEVIFNEWWLANRFEKVEEMPLSCIKVTPAQAEQIEIIEGQLTHFLRVAPCLSDKQYVVLYTITGATIGCMNPKELREAAWALNQLADTLVKVS